MVSHRYLQQLEDDNYAEYLLEKIPVYCPRCGKPKNKEEGWEVTDYYAEKPPLQNRLIIMWVCGGCLHDFKDWYHLNEDGFVVIDGVIL